MAVLEHFECFVACVREGVAYFSLRSDDGEEFWGEYEFSKLEAKGIKERRRFHLNVMDDSTMEFTAIPDKELTAEQERARYQRIDRLLRNSQ